MKKSLLSLALCVTFLAGAQTPESKIQAYLDESASNFGLTQQDVRGWMVESTANSTATGINNYYLKQRHAGIEIFGAVTNVWVKNGKVINAENRFVPSAAQKANTVTPQLTVLQGLAKAFQHAGVPVPNFAILDHENKNYTISNGELHEDPVMAELMFQPVGNTLRLAWDYTFYTPGHRHLWSIRVDAVSGEILDQHDMVISCSFHAPDPIENHRQVAFNKTFFKPSALLDIQSGSYRVIPYNIESPAHGPRQLVSNPHNATASPYGWHDTNGSPGAEFTTTRGNNVLAQEDGDSNNGTAGTMPSGGAGLTFDFPYGGTSAQPQSYTNASVTNLFYMNNILHDVMYLYGFNEANGNFQQNNYGRGGAATAFGDAVQADAQDGMGIEPNLNNANFATPVDGIRPRMQMYLWNVTPPIEPLMILSPPDIAGPRQARDNSFDPGHVPIPVAPAFIESNLVLYNDGIGDTADACTAPINASAIAGKITVVRRGDCTFVDKVLAAQNAGATAVIVVNNVEGVIGMAGANAAVTIPAISVTQAIGEELILRMQSQTVTARLQLQEAPFVFADGDFDNGIIAHEYGHGISTRLTGGPANSSCLFNNEAMGEGWSDWFALMMQLKAGDSGNEPRGIAAFAASQPLESAGIRSFPYSTDMSVNPRTLSYSNSTSGNYRYDVGEVWASMLWDLTWAYVDKYGFDPNIYTGTGGNNKVLQLVLDALKLQPCNPGFVAGRNAIIAADQATTGGQDFCMIWEVFARRGLGVNASSGSTSNANDQVEDFTVPPPGPNCTLSVDYTTGNLIRIFPNPSNGQVTVRINNFSGNVQVDVFDINGRRVYSDLTAINQEKSLSLGHLQTGIYVIKLEADNLSHTQKIVIE